MEFSPQNPIVQACLRGMVQETAGNSADALQVFMEAWQASANDYERFLSAYYIARNQSTKTDQLTWLKTALHHAEQVPNISVQTALPNLHVILAKCYEVLGDKATAGTHRERAQKLATSLNDPGPFYHGTRADLNVGDFLTAGEKSNYQSDLVMNHIYFTAILNGAGLAAALSKGDGRERIYVVEPTGGYENDPNVTDQKFPGNQTRSYRSIHPLKIVGEVEDWDRIIPEELQQWKARLAASKGEIIN
ncbi:MAG: NAD(+)--rifampin ADP-ribosyltransferase [Flavobacteriales bacterium]|nr:NAD(+)--rifampin ADP-ribosyltransferase [Bacteroidota bacterium]MCB9240153.1 NAD(+)--rifampin ADP-ribosyltransferase [Flavobacteriales bacterium]